MVMKSGWKKTSGAGWVQWTKKNHDDVTIMKSPRNVWHVLVGKPRHQKIVSRHETKKMAVKAAKILVTKM